MSSKSNKPQLQSMITPQKRSFELIAKSVKGPYPINESLINLKKKTQIEVLNPYENDQ